MLAACALPVLASADEAVPGEFIIKFKEAKGAMMRAEDALAALALEPIAYNRFSGSHHVRAARIRSSRALSKQMAAAEMIDYIEPNYRVSILATPNDERYPELWGLNNTAAGGGTANVDIDAPQAWGLTTGSEEVVIGVVDTGINYTHPDLQPNIWHNPGEIPGNGVDDDLNGVIDDLHGFNAAARNGNPLDDHGHGSHCAGTIAAAGNNTLGVVGVNWQARLMALKFLDRNGFGSTQGAIAAIEYAVGMKNRGVNLKVLSNSWGGGSYSRALEDAIRAAADRGILFVAAAGNDGANTDLQPTYPAAYSVSNVISVAAVDKHGNLASFSNYGEVSVDLAAPGVGILSTVLGSGYALLSGTSMATPHVSGVAGLVAARESALSVQELKLRLLETAKPLPGLQGQMRVPGIVDADGALTSARSPLPPLEPPITYRSKPMALGYAAALGERVLSQDDGYSVVSLGFGFPYYGAFFDRLAVSANGRVVPLAADSPVPDDDDFSNRAMPGISPYHDDLYPSTVTPELGGVWFSTNAEEARITWVAVSYAHRGRGGAAAEVRVQLALRSDGTIRFHYLDTQTGDASYDFGKSATVSAAPVAGSHGETLVLSHNTADPALYHNYALELSRQRRLAKKDFDGDGKSDIVSWRPATGMWYILPSSSGFGYQAHESHQLGLAGDIPLTGDFDGDRLADLAVWRPGDGTWYLRRSTESYGAIIAVQWGLPGDIPLVGDYDGDEKSDLAVYRESAAQFYVLLSGSGFDRNGALSGSAPAAMAVLLGGPGHDVVVGDFSGDGRADFSVVWQLIRFWTVLDHVGSMLFSLPWGEPGDTPLACDIDGDGRSDRFVVRLEESMGYSWFGATAGGGVSLFRLGGFGDHPDCAEDYDGDGKGDARVFRPLAAEWVIRSTAEETVRSYQFGLAGDVVPR